MKLNKILFFSLLFFSLLIITSSAKAKVVRNNVPITDKHFDVIKGFLYDVSHNPPNTELQRLQPQYVKAIIWLENKIKDRTITYKLEDFLDLQEAKDIEEAIDTISDIVDGRYNDSNKPAQNVVPEAFLERCQSLGTRVYTYWNESKSIDPTTRVEKIEINWKFDLTPLKSNLLYWYNNEHSNSIMEVNTDGYNNSAANQQ
tara:strand:+ start:999 stop:1601 length:603 start_codon:yes stop_codon:yes gene_type:complete